MYLELIRIFYSLFGDGDLVFLYSTLVCSKGNKDFFVSLSNVSLFLGRPQRADGQTCSVDELFIMADSLSLIILLSNV